MMRTVALLLIDGPYPVAGCSDSEQLFEFLFAKNSNFEFILKFNFNVECAPWVCVCVCGVELN